MKNQKTILKMSLFSLLYLLSVGEQLFASAYGKRDGQEEVESIVSESKTSECNDTSKNSEKYIDVLKRVAKERESGLDLHIAMQKMNEQYEEKLLKNNLAPMSLKDVLSHILVRKGFKGQELADELPHDLFARCFSHCTQHRNFDIHKDFVVSLVLKEIPETGKLVFVSSSADKTCKAMKQVCTERVS